jgi:DNA-binding XRE family transcriptional regulator
MNRVNRARLQAEGWKVGSAGAFLGLSPEEEAFVELKLALSDALRARRASIRLTQAQLAKRLRSSQSRVAKMESGDPSVSVDLLLRSLFTLGVSPRDIARVIGSRPRRALAG